MTTQEMLRAHGKYYVAHNKYEFYVPVEFGGSCSMYLAWGVGVWGVAGCRSSVKLSRYSAVCYNFSPGLSVLL